MNPGDLYLGRAYNPTSKSVEDRPLFFPSKNLTTHAVCVGMTGSGKTGLGVALIEEVTLSGIPAIVVDPKGDLGNLLLAFPDLRPSDFLPWIDAGEAARHGKTPEKYAEEVAANWKEGLNAWGEGAARIQQFKGAVESTIYTPASTAGIPLSILSSFAAPSEELAADKEALRERILSTTSSLLGLIGIEADPVKSREHILVSTLFERAWQEKKSLDLTMLIQQIQKPPFSKVGVLDTETFFPQKERMALAMRLNNLIASPGFQAWMQGEPLDIQNLLYTKEGKPRLSIVTIAHLSDAERMFFVTLLLNELLNWMRRQTGSSSLRALFYMDEIFGYFPPNATPPSKIPMLTLLKTARAFGLGIMLATQNPVDLDYKGLSNCGSWFIGKLQTERDIARVSQGLNEAEGLDKLIAACGNRIFVLRSVYQEPLLFQTRWALSYLRGPLTLTQIQTLMKGRGQPVVIQAPPETKQLLPPSVEEYFIPAETPFPQYEPKVLGVAKLHFVDGRKGVDKWVSASIAAPVDESGKVLWEEKGESVATPQRGAPAKEQCAEIPAHLLQIKNYSLFSKSFAEYLYQNRTLDLFESAEAKLTSKPEESESDFRSRVKSEIEKRYDEKIKALEARIGTAQEKADQSKSKRWHQIFDTFLSMLTAILGAFFGKRVTKGSIGQAGTAIRKAGKITTDSQAEESLESLKQQLISVQTERQNALQLPLEKSSIRPRKSDISIQTIALVWSP